MVPSKVKSKRSSRPPNTISSAAAYSTAPRTGAKLVDAVEVAVVATKGRRFQRLLGDGRIGREIDVLGQFAGLQIFLDQLDGELPLMQRRLECRTELL